MIRIGIVLVLYKQKHNLQLLYTSLSRQTENNFKIYFVDNNDDHDEILFSKELNRVIGLNIEYIKTPINSGFAGGNNMGALKAIADGCSYIFFLNNDTELEKNCIKTLADSLETDLQLGAASPIILSWTSDKENNIIQEYGSSVNFKKYKIRKNYEGTPFSKAINSLPHSLEVDLLSGAALLIKTEALKKAGLWEERYFAYGDEIDMAFRIKNEGYKQAVYKSAVVWHNHKWTKDNKIGWYKEYYLIERNKFLYFFKFKLYIQLLKSAVIDILKLPWKLIWFMKVCDLKLGFYYILGLFSGLMNKMGKPELNIFEK